MKNYSKEFNNWSYRNYYYSWQDIILEENYSNTNRLKNQKEFIYSNQIDDLLSSNIIRYKKDWTIKSEKTYFYHKDYLNSIVAITDKNGNIVEQYIYDTFWKPYSKEANGKIKWLKTSKIWNTRLFTWREYDRWLKLYYNRARYYSPNLGRFISRDPIDISDDVNLYAYASNNPVMYVDLTWTVKKWIKENEWNAWYFDEVNLNNLVWHAWLYFIYWWQDYLLSYYPKDANNPGSSQANDIFLDFQPWQNTMGTYEKDIEDIKNQLYWVNEKNKNYIELWSKNIDSKKLYKWYKNEISNLPKYNTFINNCSYEVKKALDKAWFLKYSKIPLLPWNTPLQWITPIWLRLNIQSELHYRNLFN